MVGGCVLDGRYCNINDGDCGRVSTSKNEEIHRRAVPLCNLVPAGSHNVYPGRLHFISG